MFKLPALILGKGQVAEFVFDFLPQLVADIHDLGEGALEILVIGDAGINQNSAVEITGLDKRVAPRGPGFLN